jgi:putative pyruvate formate lyase activating enzyme
MSAAYLALAESDAAAGCELDRRIQQARNLLSPCRLCPRNCGVDRLADERGFCHTGRWAVVSSYGLHFGEERPLVGRGGSGTIFFAGCNLGCVFCQNYDISHRARGQPVEPQQLANIMVSLQNTGCHNINFVTPTHVVPQILEALPHAIERGLRVPLVYNCGGYESGETLRLLDGVIDIYMPDAKYADGAVAERLSRAPDYPERMQEALVEMHRQVADLQLDQRGLAVRGLLVRHLVLPEDQAGTAEVMRLIASLSDQTYVNLMDQYRPCHQAHRHPPLDRRITVEEYDQALRTTVDAGVSRLDDRSI